MFVDTHAHLCWPEFAADLPAVLERARAAGVTRIVSIGTDLDNCRATLAIANRYPGIYAAVGLHPGDVGSAVSADTEALRHLGTHPRVVAIGETGLDYYRLPVERASLPVQAGERPENGQDARSTKQQQQTLLRAHLTLAEELGKPVVIHNREAAADLLAILREFKPTGVMHCFSGDEKFATACLELGLFLSFTGILTFKNATGLRAVAKAVPLERILLETDCPYLAPVPHRGQRNEPAYIPLIAATLAEVKGVPVEEIARVTTANAERLFRFP